METHVAGGGSGAGREGFPGEILKLGFEGPVPVSKTDKGEGRELGLADTKAHTLNCKLHGLQGPVLTKSISRRVFTKICSIPKAPGSRIIPRLWFTRMAKERTGRQKRN